MCGGDFGFKVLLKENLNDTVWNSSQHLCISPPGPRPDKNVYIPCTGMERLAQFFLTQSRALKEFLLKGFITVSSVICRSTFWNKTKNFIISDASLWSLKGIDFSASLYKHVFFELLIVLLLGTYESIKSISHLLALRRLWCLRPLPLMQPFLSAVLTPLVSAAFLSSVFSGWQVVVSELWGKEKKVLTLKLSVRTSLGDFSSCPHG